ncbi:CdaR family transcriptional regulator [Planococcus lenghuensis]|uniref:Carbohydrate diacid regulator n=1 Tax=Planococcus lenghuensis TaxID=2213202 RepID=A0A1Q2L4B8_9BACL|nr:sugar diacid recognition domain-containing protein [Planococcus lenghuensis]AQQ54702.1 hypothetical protein B0X71_17395 [Planococcus lenghuensis]
MFDLQVIGTQIVEELSSLIDKNVLVTDKNGFVIASTDPVRLNTFHEGASISMRDQKELHMTKEMCERLKGVRPGIVMPIIISQMPIGVIGVTGKPSEVEKYAKLVKRVVELFVTDFLSRQEKERGIRESEFFFFDLIMGNISKEILKDRAKLIQLNISIYQRIAIIQTHRKFEISDVEHFLRIQTIHPDTKIIRWGLERLVLLLPQVSKKQLCDGLQRLTNRIEKLTKRKTFVGIGKVTSFYELSDSFRQAETAVSVSIKQNRLVFEEDLKLELLYYSIPPEVQEEYISRTIAPLLTEKELLHSLEVWIQSTGSLKEVADELHIHKNTLTYRLAKVESVLKVNLHDSNDFAVIYTAIRLLRKK